MKKLGRVRKTNRGFEIIEFCDYNGEACTLQASSLAIYQQPGTSAIWLGCENNAKEHLGHTLSPRMHLSYKQVEALMKHLQSWLDRGSFKDEAQRKKGEDDGKQYE